MKEEYRCSTVWRKIIEYLEVYILKLRVNLKMNKIIPGRIPIVSSQDDFLCLFVAHFKMYFFFFLYYWLYSNVNLLTLAELWYLFHFLSVFFRLSMTFLF